MAEKVNDEPVLAVPVSKVMWVLVIVIIYLAYVVLGFTDHVEKVIVKRAEKLYEVVDHEMDDANDNYEKSLDIIIQGKCSDALKVFKASHICERR
tara:strand:- start:442 stop:726 length:285 start_codon:yes stop_codon:yes gene_type:complete